MKAKYDAYNSWVSFFIVTCETLITGGLFYLLFLTTEDTPWHKILQAPHLQVILTVMLCYFVSAMQIGVVLYRRKVYAYQILGKVLRSTICFGVLSGVVLELGRFMDAWSYFYLTFCKHSVNHVFSSPTSIINFTSKKPSYDDTRRSGRDNELLQRAQNDL